MAARSGKLKTTRRKFLLAAGATGAAAIAMPQVSRAQTATLKMQGSWGKADVFNEMAEDYVKRVIGRHSTGTRAFRQRNPSVPVADLGTSL